MSCYSFITDRLAVGEREARIDPAFTAVVTCLSTMRPGILWAEYPCPAHLATPTDKPVFLVDLAAGESWSMGRDMHRLESYLDKATAFIAQHIWRGPVLIHCHQGTERSPAVAVAYLCRYAGMSYAEAHAFVKQRRPQVNIPDVFALAIKHWDYERE